MKNKLITYQGGGYDGCIWEWNICLFDNKGNFHDIYSSGCSGCETRDEILHFIDDISNRGDFSIWDLEKEQYGFGNILMGGIVVELVRKLNDDFWDYDLIPHEVVYNCDECNNEVGSFGGVSTNPIGCGGIVIMNDTKLCDECYSLDTCINCDEYESGSSEFFNDNGYCQYCYDEDYDMDNVKCIELDDYSELEIDKSYKVWKYHRTDSGILTDITVVMGKLNSEKEKYPIKLFNISYGVINPNQLNLIS